MLAQKYNKLNTINEHNISACYAYCYTKQHKIVKKYVINWKLIGLSAAAIQTKSKCEI